MSCETSKGHCSVNVRVVTWVRGFEIFKDIQLTILDRFIEEIDQGLRVVSSVTHANRELDLPDSDAALSPDQKRASAKYMRVNHTGEVCAQALYSGQALVEKDIDVRLALNKSAEEELDHLAWTQLRIKELGGRRSVLDPVFYAGSFFIGVIAGLSGTRESLGFLRETERQVESHLTDHLDVMPLEDERSRAIVNQMREEEREHADRAEDLGAASLSRPAAFLMGLMSKVMTKTTFMF